MATTVASGNHVFQKFSASGTVYLTLDNQLAYRHRFEHHIQVNIVYDRSGIPVTTKENSHRVNLISDVFADFTSQCCSNFTSSAYVQPTLHVDHIRSDAGSDYANNIQPFNFGNQMPGVGSVPAVVETVDSAKDHVLELLNCQESFVTGIAMADEGSIDESEEVECKLDFVSGKTSVNIVDDSVIKHPLEDNSVRGHPLEDNCVRGHPLEDNSVRGHPLEDNSVRGHPLEDNSVRGHQWGDTDVREHPFEDNNLREHLFEDNNLREPVLADTKLTSKRLSWLSLKISRQPTNSFQKNFRNKVNEVKVKKDKTNRKKGRSKIERSNKELAKISLVQLKRTSLNTPEKLVKKTENNISDKLKIKNRDTINRQRVPKVKKLELEKDVKCEYCLQTFKSQQEYFDHRKGDRASYECSICGKLTPFKAHLMVHMRKHDDSLQEEFILYKELDSTNSQSSESKTPAGSGDYKGSKHIKCDMCGMTVSNALILKTHMMIHTGEYAYKCCVCGEKTHSIAKQSSHLATHLKSGKVQCKICNIRFETRSDLSRHQLTHEFKCSICDKAFPNKTSRVFHYKMAHKDDILKCEICGKLFSSEEELAPHLKYHRNRAKTQCTVCGLFVTRLDNHLLSHSQRSEDSKMYVCDKCPKQFKQKLSFQRHLRTHSEEKPYACMECPKRFARSGGLRRHMITHTQEKPFVCSICGKACSQMGNLRIHMQTHKDGSLVQCKICGENFSYKSSLQEHMKTAHYDDMRSQDPTRNTADVARLDYL